MTLDIVEESKKMSRYFVIGGGGFIGKSLCRLLAAKFKADVVAADLDANHLLELEDLENVETIQLDICKQDSVKEAFNKVRPHKVIHLAALMGLRECAAAPISCLDVNILGLQYVLDACEEFKVEQVLYGSSSNVYGRQKPPLHEELDPAPVNAYYPLCKYFGEKVVRIFYERTGIPSIILRIFNVFGPGQKRDRAVYRLIESVYGNEAVALFGEESASRDYLHVRDCARAIALATECECDHEIVNVGSGKSTTAKQLASMIGQKLGKDPIYELHPPRAHDVFSTRADLTKAKDLLGFEPELTLEQGIDQFLDWYLAQKG